MDTASIRNNLKESMKAHDEARTGALRMLLASVANKEKEKRYAISKQEPALSQEELSEKARLTGDELVGAVSAEVKKRKEAAGEFEKGKRPELAKKELEEAEILMAYLPA
ncbi:MAG: GatB/YqeY domain-containing protein, partial [Candidatus Wildermuthbacteria bacterium]|nr:GatB/YqeY domain-containing protein [Candidatus Wildermuthbacteria bacterium]